MSSVVHVGAIPCERQAFGLAVRMSSYTVVVMQWFDRLREHVQELGIRQIDLAKRMGIAQGAVSNVLAGRRPSASARTLQAYADALGLNVQWVMTGEGPKLAGGTEDADPQQRPREQTGSDLRGLLNQFVDLAARISENEIGPVVVGERRFREYVTDREPQHAHLIDEFLGWRARGASRYPATIMAVDVEEELVADFRRWRRGRDVGDGRGAQTVRSKTGRPFPGTE